MTQCGMRLTAFVCSIAICILYEREVLLLWRRIFLDFLHLVVSVFVFYCEGFRAARLRFFSIAQWLDKCFWTLF